MKKIALIVAFALAISYMGYAWAVYDMPIPTKDRYEIKVTIVITDRETLQKKYKEISGQDPTFVLGFTIIYSSGRREIWLPRGANDEIDLETLGHEIFYHVMENHRHP